MTELDRFTKAEASAVDYTIVNITEPNKSFEEGVALLKAIFPEPINRHFDTYKEYFAEQEEMKPDRFFFLVAKDKHGRVAGVSVFNYLDRPSESVGTDRNGIIYIEYICVHPSVSRTRLGSRLFWESVQKIFKEGYNPSAVIAEVEKANPQVPTLDKQSVLGRLRFLDGLGAKLLSGIDYRMPTHMSRGEIPAFLIIRPLHKDVKIDLWFIRSIIYALVHDGFKYDEEISEYRAEELYASIVESINRRNIKLISPLNAV